VQSSHRTVLSIALPMILSNISQPVIGLVDTAVVGHLDQVKYLGAIAVAGAVFAFLFTIFNFLRMSATGRAAQFFGAEDEPGMGRVLGQGLALSVLLGMALILAQWPIAGAGFGLMAAEPAVTLEAQRYFAIRIWAAPFVLADFVLVGWFIGLHRARAALALNLVLNITNILLDLLFVPVLGMTTDGVALASLIAEILAMCVGLVIAFRYMGGWRMIRDAGRLFPGHELMLLLRMNRDLLIRTVALMSVFLFFTAQGARQGEILLAANTILLQYLALLAYALDGFAQAAEAMVGKVIGAGRRDSLRGVLRLTAGWSFWVAAGIAGFIGVFGDAMVRLLTSIPEARAAAHVYLPWLVLTPLVAVWPFWLDGVFIGATWSREMRNSMVMSVLLFFLIWKLATPLGNHGLWLSMILFFAVRGVTLGMTLRNKLHD